MSPYRSVALAVLVALMVAACGDGDSADGGVVSIDGSDDVTTSTRLATDEALLEVSRCMRDNGIDVPDIGITGDGQLDLSPDDMVGVDLEDEEFQAVVASCLGAFRNSAGFDVVLDPELDAVYMDQLMEFSQCMRDNGLSDFPDPQAGSGTPYPLAAWADFGDQDFQDALEMCREIVPFGFGG
jgi:hypothetical protein